MENDPRGTLPGGWLPPGQSATAAPAPPTYEPAPHEPAPERKPERTGLQRLLGPLVFLGALLLKFGKVALLFAGKAKFLTTSLTMLVSIAAYTFIFGFWFAVGFVVLLLIHEMGHVIQLRREGIEASAPMFIPFLGAVVSAKSMGDDATAEARVGLAGPVLGTLGAAACIPLYTLTGNEIFKALAFTGFFLNLFNLVPLTPLDGGRAMAALSPWMWFAGLAAFAVLAFTVPNPIIVLILILGGFDTYRRFKAYRAGGEESRRYYKVTPRNRAIVLAVYLGLIALLVVGMDLTFIERDFGDV
jgi:Zn-dependent protease